MSGLSCRSVSAFRPAPPGALRAAPPGALRAAPPGALRGDLRGFVNVKKIKKPIKIRKWMGGSSPNSDFNFFLEIMCFCVFFCGFHVSKFFQKK